MNTGNISLFGTTPTGKTVHKIHLHNHLLSCDILTYGATLQSLVVPDRDGQPNGNVGELRPAAIAVSDQTGISMHVDSTMSGIHFYTANYVGENHPGKGGCTYGPRHGFCLETQFYPDAIHHPDFPSPVLRAGEQYERSTTFTFTTV